MKVFAFFLPQFHEIPENNEWWENGFTEWTNVKKGKPLFSGHDQPKQPLNDNYYNLLQLDTVKWQTKLLHDYSVDGLIYYHYYFNGKLLLEKPAENLLKNKDIDQHFFFCWANHTWFRSWEGKQDVLIEQTYGGKKEWESHFQYLLPFFRDSRYEKKDNMPIFMIFKNFNEKKALFRYFDKRCRDYGFNGIYLIETFIGIRHKLGFLRFLLDKSGVTKRVYVRQPSVAKNYCDTNKLFKISNIKLYDGNVMYDYMLKHTYRGKLFVNGLFFEWDNTPRHDKRGYIITPPNKDKFGKMMRILQGDDYIFINAWNEWAEGMMMEPTKQNGYKYLEWVKEFKESTLEKFDH